MLSIFNIDKSYILSMTMSKYDYKNKKFLEHYTCDAKSTYIE